MRLANQVSIPAQESVADETPATDLCPRCAIRPRRFEQAYCLECHAEYARENRAPLAELSPIEQAKARTRSRSQALQRRGKLVPEPCGTCGGPSEKHHEDYSDPLNVQWLCRPCHLFEHGAISLPRWIQIRFDGHLAAGPIAELLARITGPMPAWWEEAAAERKKIPTFLPTAAGERKAG